MENIIATLMNQSAPVCSCVLLRHDGLVEEISVDFAPKANALAGLMGGPLTIVGQLGVIDAVVLKRREPAEDAAKNAHVLPHPFHQAEHYGDMILVRMDANSEPQHFRKNEWTEFLTTAPFSDEAYEAWKAKHGLVENADDDEDEEEDEEEDEDEDEVEDEAKAGAEDDEDEDEDDEDDDDEDEDVELTEAEQKIFKDVLEEVGEEAEDHAIEAALLKREGGEVILRKISSGVEDEGDDADELTVDELARIDAIVEELQKKSKKKAMPSEEDIVKEILKQPDGKELVRKMFAATEEGDEDEDEEEEDEDDEDEEEEEEEQRPPPKKQRKA